MANYSTINPFKQAWQNRTIDRKLPGTLLKIKMRTIRGYVAAHGLVMKVGPLEYDIPNKREFLDRLFIQARYDRNIIASGLIKTWFSLIRSDKTKADPLWISHAQKKCIKPRKENR